MNNFNYDSMRARKARIATKLSSKVAQALLALIVGLLLTIGILLITLNFSVGLFIAGLAAWPLMVIIWYKNELTNIPPASNPKSIDDVLSSDLLGYIPPNPTPQQLAEAIMKVSSGHFFVVRFGIGPTFLTELSSRLPDSSDVIWQRSLQLKEQFGSDVIRGSMVLVALTEQLPGNDQLLAQLQLDIDDLVKGVGWLEHIHQVIDDQKNQKTKGGLGRDWSFGYTPLLERFAQNISNSVMRGGLLHRDLEGHQDSLQQMTNLLSGGGRQNAVLVGRPGVGKTTLVYALAERLLSPNREVPKNLSYRQIMALDPASLIAQARGRGELEAIVQQIFIEAIRAKNIIIFLDDAQLFLEEGTGSVDLSNLLLPILEGGGLRIILSMDEQRWLKLSQANPSLAQYMNRINIAPLDKNDTMAVLEDQLLIMESRHKVTYMYQALNEAYRLGERYIRDQAMPGQAIALLETAAQSADRKLVTVSSVQKAVEKSFGIKVSNANAASERSTLLSLEDRIHERMINQTRAVNVVSNALRRARAGVRNQNRPIGTFLFLGPTGVGKTELAKSLAAVYFGGEDHIIRLDLNEFGQPQDVDRLISDGSKDPHSLVAQISKQPFSVVLLDEIEKAHPSVLNTLLQLLDEGVLRDINNRTVSFRDAIIIATSNAGADRIRQYIDAGHKLEQFEKQFINELIDSGQFKPEFLNRFDEIVVFRPLEPEELIQVVDLMIAGVNKSLASQKISVHLSDDSKKALVQAGYDPRLGARPMRRVIQRSVENIVAKQMLSGQVMPGTVIEIPLQNIQEALKQ